MIDEIETFNKNENLPDNAIGIKIGLHRGSVIAVKANQTLDYFGQNVNIAARVQNLAHSGEIYLSDYIINESDTYNYLSSCGYCLATKEVALKGVGNLFKVHQCYRHV